MARGGCSGIAVEADDCGEGREKGHLQLAETTRLLQGAPLPVDPTLAGFAHYSGVMAATERLLS